MPFPRLRWPESASGALRVDDLANPVEEGRDRSRRVDGEAQGEFPNSRGDRVDGIRIDVAVVGHDELAPPIGRIGHEVDEATRTQSVEHLSLIHISEPTRPY